MVSIAKLTEKLIIQIDSNSTGSTSYGEYIPNWKNYKTIFASITTQRGASKFDIDIGSQNYQDVISFYCMYQRDVKDKKVFRVIYNNLTYSIQNLTVVQPNQALVLDCVAIS